MQRLVEKKDYKFIEFRFSNVRGRIYSDDSGEIFVKDDNGNTIMELNHGYVYHDLIKHLEITIKTYNKALKQLKTLKSLSELGRQFK